MVLASEILKIRYNFYIVLFLDTLKPDKRFVEPHTKHCVGLARTLFYSKDDDAINKQFTNWVTRSVLQIRRCMIKIFIGEGVVDGEGGSSEGCLKWGGGVVGWGH